MRPFSKSFWAIALLCTGALGYTLNDTITKFLIERYHVTVIIFIRSLIALPLLAAMAVIIGGAHIRWTKNIWPHAIRGAMGLSAAWLYIQGLETLSVAEATVIVFASPLIITAGSRFIFDERVSWYKWISVIVSFCGVLIAIRPGSAAFNPASLYILVSAFLYASISLSARFVRQEDNLWTVSFFGSLFSLIYVAPLTIGHWNPLHKNDILLFVGAAFCSSLAVGLSTLAYRSAPASDLAPFAYSGLIWSTLVTLIFWGIVPEYWTLIGATVVASSSAFQFWSRTKMNRHSDR